MPKLASKVCLSLFIVLSIVANCSVFATTSEQSYAPAASESENIFLSPESLPVLPNFDTPTAAAEAVAETLSPAYIADVETKPNETVSQENISTLPNADELSLETQGEEKLSQDLATPPSVTDPTVETDKGDENISTSLSPSNVDNSVLDAGDMDNVSQENTALPPSKADPPAVETKESEDLFQENTSLPPSPSVNENVSQESLSSDETKDNEILSQENTSVPALAPAYVYNTPAFDTSDDGSFTQENQSSVANVNAPAPETKGEEDNNTQDYSSATPPNTGPQVPENVPGLNDYSSVPKTAVPAPSEAVSFPESDPTIQLTPSSDETTFGSTPTSQQSTILPFNYRAEDEPVEPYEDEEDSWNGVNGAVAGVLVGACVIGVGGFIYQKRKNDNVRAQYTCLSKKEGV